MYRSVLSGILLILSLFKFISNNSLMMKYRKNVKLVSASFVFTVYWNKLILTSSNILFSSPSGLVSTQWLDVCQASWMSFWLRPVYPMTWFWRWMRSMTTSQVNLFFFFFFPDFPVSQLLGYLRWHGCHFGREVSAKITTSIMCNNRIFLFISSRRSLDLCLDI